MAHRGFAVESLGHHRTQYATWAEALFACRKAKQIAVSDLANRCGERKRVVVDWEDGTAFPRRGRVLARLYGSLPELRTYDDLIPKDVKSFIENDSKEEKRKAILEHKTLPDVGEFKDKMAAASEAARAEEEEARVTRATPQGWREALAQERTRENLSRSELASLVGVTSSSIRAYEVGTNVPIQDHWTKLVSVFPALGSFNPDSRSMEKPGREIGASYKQPEDVPDKAARVSTIEEAAVAYARALQEHTAIEREIRDAEERLLEVQIVIEDAKARAVATAERAKALHDELLKATQ